MEKLNEELALDRLKSCIHLLGGLLEGAHTNHNTKAMSCADHGAGLMLVYDCEKLVKDLTAKYAQEV